MVNRLQLVKGALKSYDSMVAQARKCYLRVNTHPLSEERKIQLGELLKFMDKSLQSENAELLSMALRAGKNHLAFSKELHTNEQKAAEIGLTPDQVKHLFSPINSQIENYINSIQKALNDRKQEINIGKIELEMPQQKELLKKWHENFLRSGIEYSSMAQAIKAQQDNFIISSSKSQ